MDTLLLFLNDHRKALNAIGGSCAIVFFCASIVYRLRKREGFSMKPRGEVLFHERFGSGSSHRNLLTKLGGAQNCLLVTVTDCELLIRPWFPFNMLFMPEIYDLEHRIPIAEISSIHERRAWYGIGLLDIEFRIADRGSRRMTLYLRGKKDFIQALKKAGVKPLSD